MGFQKNNMRSRSEKVDFFLGDFLRQLHLNTKKKSILGPFYVFGPMPISEGVSKNSEN
jgi:hypothetical protein